MDDPATIYCQWVRCGHFYDGEPPVICPACGRLGKWGRRPPPFDLMLTPFDRRFMRVNKLEVDDHLGASEQS